MSEYQYYEFLAVDRRLDAKQLAALRKLSSRAVITPTRFTNVYQYGDFRGKPVDLLAHHFDVHVYVANWGTRVLGMRVPREAADALDPLSFDGLADVHRVGDQCVLMLTSAYEDPHWEDGEGWMDRLVGVHAAFAQGDPRPAYLAWLHVVGDGWEYDDDIQPGVPPGLADLPSAQQAMIEFLRIDPFLVAAAAEHSPPAETADADFAAWIADLPTAEKDALLRRAATEPERPIGPDLLRRFRAERPPAQSHATPSAPALLERAEVLREAARQAEARAAARAKAQKTAARAERRQKDLDQLAPRTEDVWLQVENAITTGGDKSYRRAASLLTDLRDLAARDGDPKFAARFDALHARHRRKINFVRALKQAGLIT